MANIGIFIGLVLTAVAVISALMSGTQSVTAWIPAFFGAPIAAMGLVAGRTRSERHRRNAMHIMALLALLGALGGLRAAPGLVAALSGNFPGSNVALLAQLALFGLCALLLALCVRSFIAARRVRQAAAAASSA
jgi:hypothetical protein